jgi:hypothetical protein
VLTVFPCFAKEDRQIAAELSAFLERGASVQIFLEDGEIRPEETIVSKASEGLQAAVILLILSPDSAPARWVRRDWEPALLDQPRAEAVKVSTILARSCEFPPLLRRDAFFDLTQDRLGGFRQIKRWLLGLNPGRRELEFEPARQNHVNGRDAEMESLRQELADAPGVAVLDGVGETPLALEFARQSKRDFEGLVWLSCTDQTLASVAGDMASQLGMTLEGDVEENVRELGRFCAQRRLLIILDDAPEHSERLIPGGRSSTLLVSRGGNPAPAAPMPAAVRACGNVPFRLPLIAEIAGSDVGVAGALLEEFVESGSVIQLDVRYPRYVTACTVQDTEPARAHAQAVCRLFAHWAMDESQCQADLPQLRRALDWALSQEDDESWALARDLAKRGVALMMRKRRQAEAFEVLEAVSRGAELRDDRRTLEDCSREQVWILESWGQMDQARWIFSNRRALYEDQMQFSFDFP